MSESDNPWIVERIVTLYVCPSKDCGNYYGSSSMGALDEQINYGHSSSAHAGERISSRAKCPSCGAERELRYAKLVPKEDVAEALQQIKTQRVKRLDAVVPPTM